jgi:hypothetical protein
MCAVPIEKDEGCAQMMCKRCKHVFCWYCLASLDVSTNCALWCRFVRDSNANCPPRMTSCCVTTTKALAKTNSATVVHLSFGIERKSSEYLRDSEFCCSSLRHFYCSVNYAAFSSMLESSNCFSLSLAAPCIVCCKCKIEETTTTSSKLDVVQMDDVRRTDHQV